MPKDVNIAKVAHADILDFPAAPAESEILKCVDEWIDAVNSGKAECVGALYAPTAVLLPTFDARLLATVAERNEYFTVFKARRGLKASVDRCQIEILDETGGVASGLYTFRFLSADGIPQTVKARFTFVYARQTDDEWKIIAHHSSQVPA